MTELPDEFSALQEPNLPSRLWMKRLRRRCELRLAELDISNPFDISALCDELGRQRGRTIHLVPVAMGASQPSGIWITTDSTDFICYKAETTKFHQRHIIFHEIGHIICNHRGAVPIGATTADRLFPNLDTRLVHDMLRRTGYPDVQEQEAEMMASLIQASSPRHSAPRPSRGVLGSLATALGIG